MLVVDDEPDLRTLYELALLREGYQVTGVGDLAQARSLLQAQRFDVVITDMRLPDGLGIDLLHQLRDEHRSERCVVITAYGSADNAVESLKAGAFDYLTKPVDIQQFRAVIASAVQGARNAAAAGRRHNAGTAPHPLHNRRRTDTPPAFGAYRTTAPTPPTPSPASAGTYAAVTPWRARQRVRGRGECGIPAPEQPDPAALGAQGGAGV